MTKATGTDGNLSRRGFLIAAGAAALALGGLRHVHEARRTTGNPAARPPADPETPSPARLRAQVTDACFGCGLCVRLCPEVFAMDGGRARTIVPTVPPDAEERCREAADRCPAGAILIADG